MNFNTVRRFRLLSMLLGLVALLPKSEASELRWGEPDGRLQIAAIVEPGAGFADGWIRNVADAPIEVNTYFLGYFDKLYVEVHDASSWTRLKRAPNSMRFHASVGPGKSNIEIVNSRQTLIGKRLDIVAGRHICALPQPPQTNSSIRLDLGDFLWKPELLSRKQLEFRVVQELSGPGLLTPVTLRSAPITMEGTELRRVLEQLGYGAIFNRDFQDHPPWPVPPLMPPPGGTVIFVKQFPDGMKIRVEKIVTTKDEESPTGIKPYTYSSYTLVATPHGGADVVVWVKRGPHPSPQAKQGIVPFEAVEHQGWVCLLYTHFAELCLDTFRVTGDRKVERLRNGLGVFPFAPDDKVVGFQRDGEKLKAAFTRSTTDYSRKYYWLFSIEGGQPKWLQLPTKAVFGAR